MRAVSVSSLLHERDPAQDPLRPAMGRIHRETNSQPQDIMITPHQPDMELFSSSTLQNIKSCFECSSVGKIHNHHVVPRVLGGTKTIPLCETCHGKVHGRDMTNHRQLIRAGLVVARQNGSKLGRPVGSTTAPVDLIAKHDDIVRSLKAGKPLRDIAARTGKGISTVKRVKKAMG